MAERLTGNVYVDSAYTSQEAIDALGGTSSITGETLTYNVNAFVDGGTTGSIPAIGGTIFYNNVDRIGSSIYNDGTYDVVLNDTKVYYFYGVPKQANSNPEVTYARNMTVSVTGGTIRDMRLLGRGANVTLMGNLTFTANNVNFGGDNDVMGGGDSNDSHNLILGNINFDIIGGTTGGSFYVHCGSVGNADQSYKITGHVVNFTSTSAFRGIRTGGGESVYADYNLFVTSSSFTNDLELGYTAEDGSSIWEGTFTMTLTAATAANIYGFGRATFVNRPGDDNTFILNVEAAEKATMTAGVVDNFDVVNVKSGATLSASAINNAWDVNLEVGGVINTQKFDGVTAINVTGELVQADTVIITGLTTTEVGASIYYEGEEIHQGKFGGSYTLTANGDVIIHNPENITILVNSNYTDGQSTGLGVKGYSTLAAAQAVADEDPVHTTIMFTSGDTSVEPNVFSEDVVTKTYLTSFDGDGSKTLDLNGKNIIIGDTDTDAPIVNVSISNTNNINSVAFANTTGTANVSIDGSGKGDKAIGTLDMTGTVFGNAQVTVNDSVIGSLKLSDQADAAGKLTVRNSTIATVYGGASNVEADLTGGNTIATVYAENLGSQIKLAGSSVTTYMAGSGTPGADIGDINFDDAINANTLIIGGTANVIGSINANVTGGGASLLKVGGEGDTISGDVDVTISGGKFANVVVSNAASNEVTVNLAGGTVAPMRNGAVFDGFIIDNNENNTSGTFPGIVYGASISQALDGGAAAAGKTRTLNVIGHAKVNSITNFDELNVTGGTLNVAGGDEHDSVVTPSNTLTITGNINNKRAISAGVITAENLYNTGLVGTKLRNSSDYFNTVSLSLSGQLVNDGYVKATAMTVGDDFFNYGKVTATGNITISGDDVINDGELFIRSAFSKAGVFTQDGALALNNADFINSGFVSIGKLTGVKDLSTSKMYVTGGATVSGNIFIYDGAEVAFTNKADSTVANGLTLGGSIEMYDTSTLVVSGNLSTTGTKTITVNVGDLIGASEIVHAEGGVNDWTINLEGEKAGLYDYVQTATSVVIYSLDELYVNSDFSEDTKCIVDGNTLVFGINAFATVEDAVAAARAGATIVIAGDKTGMDIIANDFDVVLDDAIVGDVAVKNLFVSSDSALNSIAVATSLTIDAGAVLSVAETIPSATEIIIDASEGSGSRLVLDVDPTKVDLSLNTVSIIAPALKEYTSRVLAADPEAEAPVHVGDLYLISKDNVYFRKGNPAFVDGDTFDPKTGDALFLNENVFDTREAAETAAADNNGVLYLVGFSTDDKVDGSATVATAFEFQGGGSGIYCTPRSGFTSDADHTTIIYGTSVTTNVYGLNKYVDMSGNFNLIVKDSTTGTFYITGNTVSNKMNGNITADISNSKLGDVYIGFGDFGSNPDSPIDIDVTIRDSTTGNFLGINTIPGEMNPENKQNINANINIKMYDTVVGGTFTVLNTNNEHWNGNGASLLQTYFTVGSINVEIGGSTLTNNIRNGLSLELAGKAPQAFNVPNTLHIVATENSTTTYASYLCEWDTIIIDATANLQLSGVLQLSTTAIGRAGDNVLDDRNNLTQVMINMSGYKSGTHQVVNATGDGQIYTDANLSNITVIGDNDLTGQCQLAYTFSDAAETTLKGIYVFDKTDDMYINSGYDATISGSTSTLGQELLYGYNAHKDFTQALVYANEWGGTIVVNGGTFANQDFNGNDVLIQNGVKIGAVTMGDRKASTLTIDAGASVASAYGSGKSTLSVSGGATIGDISGFAMFVMNPDDEVLAGNVNLTGTAITIDVDGYTGGSHIVLSADGLVGFDEANVTFIGEDWDQYSLMKKDNSLVLVSYVPADTFVNPDYSIATTGTILDDGTYLEFGVNAFNTFADGLENLGGATNTLTVTGGEFEEDFEVTTGNLAFVGDTTIDGYIKGNKKTAITIDGSTVTVDSIEDIKSLVVTTDSLLTAGSIDLVDGTIYVSGSISAKTGNLAKVITTEGGIAGATLKGDDGFYVYQRGNDVYVLDLTRVYYDPTFNADISYTEESHFHTGDTLIYGVNAFSTLADANSHAVAGGTVFYLNPDGDVRPAAPANIVAEKKDRFSTVFNNGVATVVNDDITITINNTGTNQGGSAILHSGDDNNRIVFNGDVTLNFEGGGIWANSDGFAVSKRAVFNGDVQININGNKQFTQNFSFFRDIQEADFANTGTLEINITDLYTPDNKWVFIFNNQDGGNQNGDNNTNVSAKDVVLNLTNSFFDDANNGGNSQWSISLVNQGSNSRRTNYSVHISGTTVKGLLSGVRNRAQNAPGNDATSQYAGTKTLYVDSGVNELARAIEFHHIVINADATLNITNIRGSYGNNVPVGLQFMISRTAAQSGFDDKSGFVVNMKGYEGSDKMLISMNPNPGQDATTGIRYGGNAATYSDLAVVVNDIDDTKYAVGLGLTRGLFIITKNGDVLYNADISVNDNGTAFGSTFVLVDETTPENTNAFNSFANAKAAIATRPGANLYVSGNGDPNNALYLDGYDVTIIGGTYNSVFGTDDEASSVASVNITVTDGLFFGLSVSDGTASVTGDALININGGSFGKAAAGETPAVLATISGSNKKVSGTSTLLLSKDLVADATKADIIGSVTDFDAVEVAAGIANMVITNDLSATAITIDASSVLTVQGTVTASTITIDTTTYDGPTKALVLSDSFKDKAEADLPAVIITGDTETYSYTFVENTLYLVSTNAGNVYVNSTWDPDVSGRIYNGDLLVWDINASDSMEFAVANLTEQYTLYVTGGEFAGDYTFGKANIDIRDDGSSIGGLVLGDGSSVTISGFTSGTGTIGSIAAVEGSTAGLTLVVEDETAFGTVSDVSALTVAAGKNISATSISFLENGGTLTVDFEGYEQATDRAVVLATENGIENFLQPVSGQEYSRTTVKVANDDNQMMAYYDETEKAVIAQKAGLIGIVAPDSDTINDNINGTVMDIGGTTATMVYGYNISNNPEGVAQYIVEGGTIFAENAGSYYFFMNNAINAYVKNIQANGFVVGYDNGDQYHPGRYHTDGKTRRGDFTLYAENVRFSWYTDLAGMGYDNGTDDKGFQTLDITNADSSDATYDIKIVGSTNDCALRVAEYAKISGGTVNVLIDGSTINSDIRLFENVYNNGGDQLKQVNLAIVGSTATAARWIYLWDIHQDSTTNLNLTITNTSFTGATEQSIGLFGACNDGNWTGRATVTISGFTTQGRLDGLRGDSNTDSSDTIFGTRNLVVESDSFARVVRNFSNIEVADGVVLSVDEIRLARNAGIVLRGETDYEGDVKEYIVASGTITGIDLENAEFLDADDNEIDGYRAAIGNKSVFIYKTTGDVFYSTTYTQAITGTTVTDRDGKVNFLVYGDNAVNSYAKAMDAVEERGGAEEVAIQVQNALATDFYAQGYTLVMNGGQITNLFGGNKPDTEIIEVEGGTEEVMVEADEVDFVDITVNAGVAIANVIIANEYSAVDGDALLTVADGVSFTGTLDGGLDYVDGDSELVFLGDATAAGITGFTNVTLCADGLVELSGAFSGETITIDAEGFTGFTKKVLVAEGGFVDVDDITVEIINGDDFDYEFSDDGKTLLITSELVVDTFVNSAWTAEDVKGKFVDDTALIWDKNAFASITDAAAALGDDGLLTIDGGAFTDAVTLTKNNDVAISANTTGTAVGDITADGGILSVEANLTAGNLSGFSTIGLASGKTITVNGGITLADVESTSIVIDVTGYSQDVVDAVVISTTDGITGLADDTITVTGQGVGSFYAYYDSTDKDVHLMRIDNFYVDVAFGTAGEHIVEGQTNSITGERLIWGVNAFYELNDALDVMAPGQNIYVNGRIGNDIRTGGRMANFYITGSTIPTLINGLSGNNEIYKGDVWMTIENSWIAGADNNDTLLFGRPTGDTPWSNPQYIIGNVTLNVIGSTIASTAAAHLTNATTYYVRYVGPEGTMVTLNFVDSVIANDMCFLGDSAMGNDYTVDGVAYKGANAEINFTNVVVPYDKWWRIMDGGQGSHGTVTFNITGSTIGAGDGEMRFSLGGAPYGDPSDATDFDFVIEGSTIVGYLQNSDFDNGDHAEATGMTGKMTITLKGENDIRYTYWFDEITLTAGATLTGRGLKMASAGGTINVDITGYTGKSKVLVSMSNEDITNVSSLNVIKEEGSTYDVVLSKRAIVIKGAVKDLYVNNTYTVETCPAGTIYNDDMLFFGENAFATDADAIPALTEDAVLYFTGGDANVLTANVWANDISIDATASLSYSGTDAITIAADLINNGTFTISAAGFVESTPADVVVLTADSITGTGSFATDDDDYMITVLGNEVHLILKQSDVYVSTDWADLPAGTDVSVGTIGVNAFGSADAAAGALGSNGSVYVLAGEDVASFTNAITFTVVAQDGAIVKGAVGTASTEGSLTVQSGAIATGISVRAKGTLTVEAGATVTGGLSMLKGAAVSFADDSVLDFDISGATAGDAASVTNFSLINGTPNYSVTLAAGQAEGEYLLASDAAGFTGSVTLMVGNVSIGSVALNATASINGYDYTLAINDNSELAITIEEGILPDTPTLVYVNSEWSTCEEGDIVPVGTGSAKIGYDAFATLAGGIAGVTDDGNVEVVGGSVSFADGYSKTITVNDGAFVVGTAVFNAAITIDGTIVFSTAIATADAAQFDGFSFISGDTKYTLVDATPAVGTYLLMGDAATFAGSIEFGLETLTLGGEAVVIGDFSYAISITNNNELALQVSEYVPPTPTTPTLAYVNSEWATCEEGDIVPVAGTTAKIGYDAFATLAGGIAGVTDDGSVIVAGGTVSFADGYYKTITVAADATVVGTGSFLNRPITIDGTIAFDAALTTRTTAQFADVQFISGDTKYTLTFDAPAVGVYMLASGLWYDDLYQPVFNGSVTFGDAVLTVGNDVTIDGLTYGLRTNSNLELLLVVDKAAPAPTSDVSYLTATLTTDKDTMIGTVNESTTEGFVKDVQFYWSINGAPYGGKLGIEDGWVIAGVGDFNGNGMDGVLRYCTEGDAYGLVVADNANGNGTFTPAVLNRKDASWDILGIGDFNGDGLDDILVANRTAASSTIGLLGYWASGIDPDTTAITSTWTLINGYSDEWTLVDTGDYDGNGCTDMLWKNSFVGEGGLTYNAYCTWRLGELAPETYDWSIVMVAKVNETETPDTDAWKFLATGDFNGDSISDIAMINDVGTVAIAEMSATGTSTAWTIFSAIDTDSWNLAGVADVNGDGIDDMIWSNKERFDYGSLTGYWQGGTDPYGHAALSETGWVTIGYLA